MSETKPDCYCTLQDLKDLTILPYGWVMIRRSEGGVADLEDFEIKMLGGVDPLAENAALKRMLNEMDVDGYLQQKADDAPLKAEEDSPYRLGLIDWRKPVEGGDHAETEGSA